MKPVEQMKTPPQVRDARSGAAFSGPKGVNDLEENITTDVGAL